MVELKFCGGCNSQYDRKKVYESLLDGYLNGIFYNRESKELVILNGCRRGCVKSKNYIDLYDKVINTQAYLISRDKVSEDELVEWILNNID
ncbi:hypothetical protein [Thermoanaerobacter siderophilus]|uniref:Uncharacterized protein n=1 Tax=Thermoanaerobacter siderophilus SR4 TaxID=880478 RepID=I8QZH7_9THEO|nr:hypothetical protein [Thermoanaerobacter siderophilus]EIW00538.1 hypothetical protein ThesiDRAFT1_1620 [Thermoanaerobacter siderophilus SR4]